MELDGLGHGSVGIGVAKSPPFQQEISLLHTFTADINATENIQHQGLLILTERHGKQLCPGTHRSAIQGINPRSRAHFPRQPKDFTSATKKGLRAQKGRIIPALFCCNNMKDARSNQWHLNMLPDPDTIHGVRISI